MLYSKALELGYRILAFHEVWSWSTFSDTLFKRYIRTFYKVKLAKSGWPPTVRTPDQRRAFFAEIEEKMGITLTEAEMEDNPALRSVSKLLLNTSWGAWVSAFL